MIQHDKKDLCTATKVDGKPCEKLAIIQGLCAIHWNAKVKKGI